MAEQPTETIPETTTRFKGDIIFNNGTKDVKTSELPTNESL